MKRPSFFRLLTLLIGCLALAAMVLAFTDDAMARNGGKGNKGGSRGGGGYHGSGMHGNNGNKGGYRAPSYRPSQPKPATRPSTRPVVRPLPPLSTNPPRPTHPIQPVRPGRPDRPERPDRPCSGNGSCNVDIDVGNDGDYHYGWDHYDSYWGWGMTTLVLGSIIYSLPSECSNNLYDGVVYKRCYDNWFAPAYQGTNLVYVAVADPRI